MISFVNFARIASICAGFHLGTLHGYFFHKDFWPNLNFPLEYQIKRVLIVCKILKFQPYTATSIAGSSKKSKFKFNFISSHFTGLQHYKN